MKYYIANWKMNLDLEEVKGWLQNFPPESKLENIIIAAPFPYLYLVKEGGFRACAQDVSAFDKGACTGEVGAFQIADFCNFCLVGHSERKENLEIVAKKRDKCLEVGVTPVVCFAKMEDAFLLYKDGVVLAWEDPQNISVNGDYNAKDPGEIRTDIQVLKATLPEGAQVIYGGSVNKENIEGLKSIENLDGVLVGNASLDPNHFYEICKS